MKILTLNSGSSSLKYKLFRSAGMVPLACGAAERIGEEGNRLVIRWRADDGGWCEREIKDAAATHGAALEIALENLSGQSVLRHPGELIGMGHRVVHGGARFIAPTRIDDAALADIRALENLAPLHNPANVLGIEVALNLFPHVPQVAVFDTAFHHTLPGHACHYALPSDLVDGHHVRRYGFHGTSVQYVVRRAAELLCRPAASLNAIVLHLGNGASATAIANGRSIDTSMGMTPLEGLMMGTRCGDLDPALHFYLLRHAGYTPETLEQLLFHQSGFKGVCGASDMRDVHALADRGEASAVLALEMFCYRLKKYVGAYAAVLGRVDAVLFTGGIGEHDAEVRERALAGLQGFGVKLDVARNRIARAGARAIHADESRTQVWVIPTDEEHEIARSVLFLVTPSERKGDDL